jgi:TatD DNase family protein
MKIEDLKYFDSHCHLNSEEYIDSYQRIADKFFEDGLGMINIGNDFASSRRGVEMSEEFVEDPFWTTVGIHPDMAEEEDFDEVFFGELCLSTDKVVAIGEIGLDYFGKDSEKLIEIKERQLKIFHEQLSFAEEHDYPVVLHARGSEEDPFDAYHDMHDALLLHKRLQGGVLHCFTSSAEIAERFIELGFMIGLTGIITFDNKSAEPIRKMVEELPLEKILIETDAPYLSPQEKRGELNEPQNVKYVAEKIAEIKKVSLEEVFEQTKKNTVECFGLNI